jgi:hypothetical protein
MKSITEKVKTFEGACKVLGLNPNLPIVEHLPEKDRQSIIAYYKLIIIVRALNEGWEPDFTNFSQPKYWVWFYIAYAGFVYAYRSYAPSATYTIVGSRLCFKSPDLAEYASEQFRELYLEHLFIKDLHENYSK